MCQASSYCNLTAPCTTGQQYLCGPYLIGFPYWQEAGQPVLDGDDPDGKDGILNFFLSTQANQYSLFLSIIAHEHCTSNKACAERTVRNYMAIHEQVTIHDAFLKINPSQN